MCIIALDGPLNKKRTKTLYYVLGVLALICHHEQLPQTDALQALHLIFFSVMVSFFVFCILSGEQ